MLHPLPLLLLFLLSFACTTAPDDASPSCDDGACDQAEALVEISMCQTRDGQTFCDDIDATDELCGGLGTYRFGDTHNLHFGPKQGATCILNGSTFCHKIHITADATHLVCTLGGGQERFGFDGVPLDAMQRDMCSDLSAGERTTGLIYNRLFTIQRTEEQECRVFGSAADFPRKQTCHDLRISPEGFHCKDGPEEHFWPFAD